MCAAPRGLPRKTALRKPIRGTDVIKGRYRLKAGG